MRAIFIILFLCFTSLNAFSQNSISRTADLPVVLKKIEKDKVQKLERMIALEFHKLLNQYRKANKLDTLAWSDILWLTARNHNFYMIAKNDLTHDEEAGEQFFTGVDPGARLKYTQGNKGGLSWSGENCLYRTAQLPSDLTNDAKLLEYAKDLARKGLEQWQSSPPHNRNMLGTDHKMHGAAFNFDESLLFATDLFGYGTFVPTETQTTPKVEGNAQHVKPTKQEIIPQEYKEIVQPFSPSGATKEVKRGIVEKLQKEAAKAKEVQAFSKAAQHHLNYLYKNEELTSGEDKRKQAYYAATPGKRVAKATYGSWAFLKPKFRYVREGVALVEIEESEYDAEQVVNDLWKQLIIHIEGDLSDYAFYGISVKVKRTKQGVKIYAVLVLNP